YLTGSKLLGFSSYNWIDQCSVRSVHYGITLMSSTDNYVMSTSVADCYYGIYIVNSPRCVVNDTVVSGCSYGIWIHQSDGTWVSCNEVTGSEWTGVFLYSSSYCEVHQNVVSGSFQRGIRLTDARSNHITHNDFVDNWIQAYEEYESTGNLWDDGYPAGGNYWSDYDGVDYLSGVDQTEPGSDGIGDTPYVLASGSQDNYPLMVPFASPNNAPIANFSVSANPWEVWEIFEFDASSSWDYEDDLAELQVRWDWENDGVWDTPWSYDKMAYHIFEEPGEHFVALEVVDTGGLTDTSVLGIYVPDVIEPTPPNTFNLPFATTDVVFDPERPYAYITDKYAMKLYFVNLTDGSVDQTFVFQYMTESLAMTPDGSRLFVALLTREHDPCWFEGQVGYIASIDLETQVKDREFMIDEDPFDLLATSNGHLVVSPGSGQWDYIRTYDATDGTPIGSAFIRHMSRLSMHPSEAIVYAADTDVSPSDITRFDLSRSGDISLAGDSPYHGDYEMAGNVWVNPLGDSLVVRGGHVLTAGLPISLDMYYVMTMTTATPIADVEFDLAYGLVLSLEGSQLCWYDIESYEALGNTSTGSDMEFLGLSGGTVYCVDAEWSSTTIIWFDSVSA
ncbi:MAG: hypothetical protein QG582_532, partial [Candidatus Thermoplasmatota archaeon]|nr:hypothetical protein [Candidatus Thermoplasmatota archaeon]